MIRVLALASVLAAQAFASEKDGILKACDELIQEFARVKNAYPGNNNISQSWAQAWRSLNWLAFSAREWKPKSETEGLLLRESLERMATAMRTAKRHERSLEDLMSIAAEDLDMKREFCSFLGLSTLQKVRVVTKREGLAEVKGLEVWYLEKFFETNPGGKPRQFGQFSSPAVEDLVPGRYLIWAKEADTGGKAGPRKEARIGLEQKDVEVLAP